MRKVSTLVGLTALILAGAARAQDEAPAAAPAGDAAAPAAAAPAPAETTAAPAAPAASDSKMQLGINLLPMLMGKTKTDAGDFDLKLGYGVGLSFGYAVIPGLYVGVAPQAIFNVKGKDATGDAAKEYDLLARVAYAYTVAPKINVMVEVMPGYSIVSPPSGDSAKGLVVAGGIGASYDVTDQAFVNLGVGYQYGMQKQSDFKANVSFLRIAVGGGMKF